MASQTYACVDARGVLAWGLINVRLRYPLGCLGVLGLLAVVLVVAEYCR